MTALQEYGLHVSMLTGHEVDVDAAPEPVPIDPDVAAGLFDIARTLVGAALRRGAVRVMLRAADGHLVLRIRSGVASSPDGDTGEEVETLRLATVRAEVLGVTLCLTEPGSATARYELRYPLGPRSHGRITRTALRV